MNILLVGDFTYRIYAPAFEIGFIKLGHNVYTIKYNDYLYGNSKLGVFISRIQNRYHYGVKMFAYNRDIIKAVENNKIDFVFLYRCYHVWPSTIKKIQKKGCFIFTYNNDDPFSGVPSRNYYRYFYKSIKLANYNFVYRKKNYNDYKRIGAKCPTVLLPYFMEDTNFYEVCNKDIEVSYLGHFEQDGRDESLMALIKAGIPVEIYSTSYWERSKYFKSLIPYIKPGVSGLEYNHNINRSKISLAFLSKTNNDTYTRRCFEIPAAKTLMLSEYTEDLAKMFPPDECAVYFKSDKELVEKVKYLLSNVSEIERISENGYRRLMELGCTEVDRCNEIIKVFEDEN